MKFSIITPAWNVGPWLTETMLSVLSQAGDFELEYIVVTDPSSDDTVAIAQKYARAVGEGVYHAHCTKLTMRHIELHGSGSMYAALNAGFAAATGDIFAWIPGDDTYTRGAFEGIRKALEAFPHILWIKGYGDTINTTGARIARGDIRLYHQPWLQAGVYGMEAYHVNQESVFWRRELSKRAGPFPDWLKSMGDYWLWTRFARHARLWSTDIPVSSFRKREGQDSRINHDRCRESMWQARGNRRPLCGWVARLFFYPYDHLLPSGFKIHAERLYPFFFPHHTRTYVTLRQGTPEIATARSFVISPHSEG